MMIVEDVDDGLDDDDEVDNYDVDENDDPRTTQSSE